MDSSNSSQCPSESHLPGPKNSTLSIFLISVLGLFLELMLIRWIGTEVRIFAYLQNTVLIVCFLGLGMGCFTCRQRTSFRSIILPVLAITVLLVCGPSRSLLASITDRLSVLGDLVIWQAALDTGLWGTITQVSLGLLLTLGLMVLLWEVFVPIGRILGRLMDDHPRTIWAYSVNIAGSLLGIWLFVVLSAASATPWVWLLVASLLLLAFWGQGQLQNRMLDLGLVATLLVVGMFADYRPGVQETVWSPYQKLDLIDVNDARFSWKGKCIMVNNAGYQGMMDLSPGSALLESVPRNLHGLSQYDLPLRIKPDANNVLIVGAGSGNDVAGALRGGARQITAVEIDPVIISMGKRHHPERPYDSPRVRVVNDDARSFFATTSDKYELIVFGLLDSHTTTAMTNARLDHYVYTLESLQRAADLLTDDGVIVLSFEAVKPYIADRMALCIDHVFGRKPLTFRVPAGANGWGGMFFVTGNQDVIEQSLTKDHLLASQIGIWQATNPVKLTYSTRIATDDWPYIYLQHAKIPTLYFLLGGLLLVLLIYGKLRLRIRGVFGGWQGSHWHFFFMGAAFLLLEVQNISKASVALGNTWLVNAVIISGILVMILLANWITARHPKLSQVWVCSLLIGSCLALYFVDLSRFAFLPFALKAVVVGTLTTLPMLFAGIVFIESFTRVPHKNKALGANLIGSLVGGLPQSLTFMIGIKALLLVVAGLYAAALLLRPRQIDQDESDLDALEREHEVAPQETEEETPLLEQPVGV